MVNLFPQNALLY